MILLLLYFRLCPKKESRLPLNKDKRTDPGSHAVYNKKAMVDCIDHVKGIEENYWASDIARDEMPESVVINLDSDYNEDSATDTASENEDEI